MPFPSFGLRCAIPREWWWMTVWYETYIVPALMQMNYAFTRPSRNYLPWFPSLSLCLRCAMSKYMVVAMQREYPHQAQQVGDGARGDEEEEKSDYAHLDHLQLWLELSSLLQLTAVAILLPFLYNYCNKSLHSQLCSS